MTFRILRSLFNEFRFKKRLVILAVLLFITILFLIIERKRKDYNYNTYLSSFFNKKYYDDSMSTLSGGLYDLQRSEIDAIIDKQKCKIPALHPFHPEIQPHLMVPRIDPCRIKKYGVVNGNILQLKLRGVTMVSLYYIERLNDFMIQYSDRVDLMEEGENSIDLEYEVKGEFFKVEILFTNEGFHEEYHFAFLKPPVSIKKDKDKKKAKSSQLNILLLYWDASSTAHVMRSLKKTYKYLKDHPRNVFMRGHTIVGDGTTAQMCALLTGHPEKDLSEARRGFPNAKTVDKWPFLFNDLHKHDYKTVFTEDDTEFGMFQYRLLGFNKPPTTHYLRPLWLALKDKIKSNGISCGHQIHFEYINKFFEAYKEDNKFIMVFNALNHNSMTCNVFENADEDLYNFYKALDESEYANNTIVFFGGDHGLRTGPFRSTLHGKLEERLPVLSIMLPRSFDKYPHEVKNLRRNSYLMTSHFDVYATLQHLMTFPKHPDNIPTKYGKSLFTDLRPLNRTCAEAGVDKHWCTCLNYERVSTTSDKYLVKFVNKVIDYINELNTKFEPHMCHKLKFKDIKRAGRRTPNKEVNQFVDTLTKEGGCDSCGVKYDKQKSFSRYQYEVVFSVSPSGGVYEASGEVIHLKDGTTKMWHSTAISRINLYGEQPFCVSPKYPHLRKFCYCKKKKKKRT